MLQPFRFRPSHAGQPVKRSAPHAPALRFGQQFNLRHHDLHERDATPRRFEASIAKGRAL